MSIGPGSTPGVHDAARLPESQPEHARRSCACVPGSEVWVGGLLENRVVQRQVRHQLLETSVLSLKVLEVLGLVELESSVRLPPPVERLLRDANLPPGYEPDMLIWT